MDGDPLTTTLTTHEWHGERGHGWRSDHRRQRCGHRDDLRHRGADQCGADWPDPYTNTPDYNGSAQITVATNDGTVTTTDTIGITVTPVALDITNDTL